MSIPISHSLTVWNLLHICVEDLISYPWRPKTHFVGIDMDFWEQEKGKTMSKNLKMTNFSKYHFINLYIHGNVLQHENALSHIFDI